MDFRDTVSVTLEKCNASDLDVARAAWVSTFGSDAREKDPERVAGLVKYLYRNKHMSPFEHGSFTFMVECPIFVAREFMRHRTFSYNEVSGRYTDMKPVFYILKEIVRWYSMARSVSTPSHPEILTSMRQYGYTPPRPTRAPGMPIWS